MTPAERGRVIAHLHMQRDEEWRRTRFWASLADDGSPAAEASRTDPAENLDRVQSPVLELLLPPEAKPEAEAPA